MTLRGLSVWRRAARKATSAGNALASWYLRSIRTQTLPLVTAQLTPDDSLLHQLNKDVNTLLVLQINDSVQEDILAAAVDANAVMNCVNLQTEGMQSWAHPRGQ